MTITKTDKPYFQFLLLPHCTARTVGYFQSKTKELDHFLTEKFLQKGRECKTIHNLICKIQSTLIYKFYLHCFMYIPGRPSWRVLCSYWSQMIMWTVRFTTTLLWFPENGGSMGLGVEKESNITGQVRSYKYVRNKKGKNCGILLVKASRPLWSID